MNSDWKKLLISLICLICLDLLAGGAGAANSELESGNGQAAEPADQTDGGVGGAGDGSAPQKEDLLDRAFTPLDRAVSDINRTLNKEDNGADAGSND